MSTNATPSTTAPSGPAIGTVDTPLGDVHVAATTAGIAAIGLGPMWSRERLLDDLRRRGLAEERGDATHLERAGDQLREYMSGERRRFDLALDLRGLPAFTSAVLGELQRVGFGEVVTYGTLASKLGKPGASRAVGQANGRNPVPIVVPCHRVVATNGLGGFSCGLDLKRWLLRHEGRQDLAAS